MPRESLQIAFRGSTLAATIGMHPAPVGWVVFAHHGRTPRNVDLAVLLECRGFATIVPSFGVEHDDADGFAERVIAWLDHVHASNLHRGLPIGLFGATIGGAAALIAATRRSDLVSSVVCCSTGPDLLGPRLAEIRTPTLLVAGSRDTATLRAMRDAAGQIVAPHRAAVISGATEHLDDPGALDEVAAIAAAWHLGHSNATPPSAVGAGAR